MKKILIGLFTVAILLTQFNMIYAAEPYQTYTKGEDGEKVESPTAYEPGSMYHLNLEDPQDIFYDQKSQKLYIADTMHGRIVYVKNQKSQSFGKGILKEPSGIYVKNNNIYVADSGHKKIYIFNQDYQLIKSISKPTEPLYGEATDFVPTKVSVDNRGNIFVISQGNGNGVVQLNNQGHFLGYVASNQSQVSFDMLLKRIFFTQSQKNQLFKNLPPSPTSITLDQKGLIYTGTLGLLSDSIKKFNAAGKSMLANQMENDSQTIMDIAVDNNENIYSVDEDGFITITDSYGNLLVSFGSQYKLQEIKGVLKSPVAIDVSESGEIYVLDKEQKCIQTYLPTEFTELLYKGVTLYKEGLYVEAKDIFEEILTYNSSFMLSYQALAKAYFKEGRYEEALTAFEVAQDKEGYSESFWEIRNLWLQNHLGMLLSMIVILILMKKGWNIVSRKTSLGTTTARMKIKIKEIRVINELLESLSFIKHPINSFYELKFKHKISFLTASLLYILFIGVNISGYYLKAYLFNETDLTQLNLFIEGFSFIFPIALFISSHYLVTSIQDGEATLGDLYKGTVCSFIPYILCAIPLWLLTHILTYNERFIYDFVMLFMIGYSLFLIFMMIKELNNYTIRRTFKIIALTVFTAVMIVLLIVVIGVLAQHLIQFIESIIQEVIVRG